jgi:putative hemolysin
LQSEETVVLVETRRDAIGIPTDPASRPLFEHKGLTYSNTFDSSVRRNIIRAIEWMTGKARIFHMLRQFEREWPANGRRMWNAALHIMRIELLTPQEQVDHIPKTGPVVFVANHPHGMVDGLVMAELIETVRDDYQILTRSVLTGINSDAGKRMISVPFPHEPDAQEKMVEMRRLTLDHLSNGGLVALFPSGVVASSDTFFGPAIEREWNVFTAKLIRKSGAKVVPCYFPGANSRWYQIAGRLSATLRQSLLLHEIVASCGKPQKPVIGPPLDDDEVTRGLENPRSFMAALRERTLALGR